MFITSLTPPGVSSITLPVADPVPAEPIGEQVVGTAKVRTRVDRTVLRKHILEVIADIGAGTPHEIAAAIPEEAFGVVTKTLSALVTAGEVYKTGCKRRTGGVERLSTIYTLPTRSALADQS